MSQHRVRLFRYVDPAPRLFAANDSTTASKAVAPLPAQPISAFAGLPSHRERAQALSAHRRERERWFGEHAKLLQGAAWDLLLELFLCHEDGRTPSTTSAAYGAGVPPTTALRALKKLTTSGIVKTWIDAVDTRVRRVELAPEAVAMMRSFLDRV